MNSYWVKMIFKEINGKKPQTGENCFFAENSVVVGDVVLGDNCSVWYSAVIRGDVNSIRLGNNVNIQDGAVVHCTYRKYSTQVGNNVTVGHNAIVHGCTIHDSVLVGMGAIVMDGCVVESGAIIAAGAVVTEGTYVKAGTIYGGIPARKVKENDTESIILEIEQIAKNYIKYSEWYKV